MVFFILILLMKRAQCLSQHQQSITVIQFKIIQSNNTMLEPVVNLVKRIYQIESYKLRRKGIKNILIAYGLLYSYFFLFPEFVHTYIWPDKIENKMMFQWLVTISLHILGTSFFSLIYIPGYLGVESYRKYENEPTLKKPWEKSNWQEMKWRTFWNLLINYGIIVPAYLYFGLGIAGVSMRFQGFPTSGEIIKQMIILLLANDFIYMCIHRILHQVPFLYKFHKVHHEYDTVFCALGQYAHPVEEVLGNLIPGSIVFAFYKVHIFTVFFYQIYKLYNSAEGHSGYDLPWSPTRAIPFVYTSNYHNFHHSKNIGNYATSLYLFEIILGTNKTFFDIELAKDNQETALQKKLENEKQS